MIPLAIIAGAFLVTGHQSLAFVVAVSAANETCWVVASLAWED